MHLTHGLLLERSSLLERLLLECSLLLLECSLLLLEDLLLERTLLLERLLLKCSLLLAQGCFCLNSRHILRGLRC